MNVAPCYDRVLIKRLPKSATTEGGVIVPERVKDLEPDKGLVVAVGPGHFTRDGCDLIPLRVQVGDKVILTKSELQFNIKGVPHILVPEKFIIAVVTDSESP